MVDNQDVRPWDLLNPNKPRSSEELAEYRLKICQTCEFFKPLSQRCSKCGKKRRPKGYWITNDPILCKNLEVKAK